MANKRTVGTFDTCLSPPPFAQRKVFLRPPIIQDSNRQIRTAFSARQNLPTVLIHAHHVSYCKPRSRRAGAGCAKCPLEHGEVGRVRRFCVWPSRPRISLSIRKFSVYFSLPGSMKDGNLEEDSPQFASHEYDPRF